MPHYGHRRVDACDPQKKTRTHKPLTEEDYNSVPKCRPAPLTQPSWCTAATSTRE